MCLGVCLSTITQRLCPPQLNSEKCVTQYVYFFTKLHWTCTYYLDLGLNRSHGSGPVSVSLGRSPEVLCRNPTS